MKGTHILGWVVRVGLCLLCALPVRGQESRRVSERGSPSGHGLAAGPSSSTVSAVLSQDAQAAVPGLVKFAGVLTDLTGRPLSGEAQVTFALYKLEKDEEPIWKETQKVEADQEGGYTALLGVTQSGGIPSELFRSDEARWLGVQVEGQPQQARILLVNVGHALRKSVSDFVLPESLGEQIHRVIGAQSEVAGPATSTEILQQGQTQANSALSPQVTSAGPKFPPSTFSGTTSDQIVLVQQNGTGAGLVAATASPSAAAGFFFASNTTGTASGVLGVTNNPGGAGVIGVTNAPSVGANGVYGKSTSTGGSGVFGDATASSGFTHGVTGQTVSPDGTGVIGVSNSSFGDFNNAVLGVNNATSGNAYGVSGVTATSGFGAGVIGAQTGTSGTAVGVIGKAYGPNGFGMFAEAASTSGHPIALVASLDSNDGGVAGQFITRTGEGLLLQGLSGSSFRQVFSLDANGNLNISGNLTVSGTKSSTAKLQNGREVALYAVESPENWFEDFGSGELKNGVAWVPLDAAFGEATNAAVSYHVFLTPNGDSNGLYVARKTAAGFEVREHAGGGSNVAFDYRIVVRRRGYETLRMAEVHRDVQTLESSRQHLAQLANSWNLRKPLAPTVPQTVLPHAIRPIAPRPSVPKQPQPTVPQVPRASK